MMEAAVSELLDWSHTVQDIPEEGLTTQREASQEERQAVAAALDLVACAGLTAHYTITPRGQGHYRLAGTLHAQVEQTCVVTLEALTNSIDETYSVDFWPETELPAPSGGAVDVHDEPDLEPIVAGRIEVGRIIFECLAGAIDLFPRKPGVSFEPPESPESPSSGPQGPFAALANIRNKR
jgi:hypothetical protein